MGFPPSMWGLVIFLSLSKNVKLKIKWTLQINLLLTYLPSTPNEVSYFDLAMRREMPALIAGNLGLPQPQNVLLSQFPTMDGVRLQGKLDQQTFYGLEKAVGEAGGIEALLFLVAKVKFLCKLSLIHQQFYFLWLSCIITFPK